MKSFTDLSLKNYLSELSSDAPVPGGGSVSAYVASLATGLSLMVGRVACKRKPKADWDAEKVQEFEARHKEIKKIVESIEKTQKDAFQVVDLDPEVFDKVMNAAGADMEDALQNSFRLQADLALLVIMAREGNMRLANLVKGSIANDLLVAASLYEAAFHGAFHTAMINVKYMKDEERKKHAEEALDELDTRFRKGTNDES